MDVFGTAGWKQADIGTVAAPGSYTTNTVSNTAVILPTGNTFTTYKSSDGINYTLVKQETIAMGNTVYVGMYVCSHATTTTLANATFDHPVLTQP